MRRDESAVWPATRVLGFPSPDAGAHTGQDVAELAPRRALVPAATAPAVAVGALVQRDALALATCAEAKLIRSRSVDEALDLDPSG
jgi:hypothetical protein